MAHPKAVSFLWDTEIAMAFRYCSKPKMAEPQKSDENPALPAASSCLSGVSDLFVAAAIDFDKGFAEVVRSTVYFYDSVNPPEIPFEIVLPPPRRV